MKLPRIILTLGICAVTLLTLASPVRAQGVTGQWNTPMCGSNAYERIKTTTTEYAVIDTGGTCVDSERYHADFAVAKVSENIPWQYPALISGYVPEGEPTCASAHDTCYTYPVKVSQDGTPVASFGSWISAGYSGNESFDIWFSPDKSRHSITDKAGDTELMIWTSYPGVNDTRRFVAYATIDHMRFGIMSWVGGGPHRYVAYLWLGADQTRKGHQVNMRDLWLNPFFRNAETRGWLNPGEWLWAVDLGFEMNSGGTHNNIHGYSLSKVNL
jgi:hypothetical protein